MAKAIICRSTAVCVEGAGAHGQVELYLDNAGDEIPAVFGVALHTGNTTIPFIAVDPKGIVTFRYEDASVDGDLSVDIMASEADGTTTTETATGARLAGLDAGAPLTSTPT